MNRFSNFMASCKAKMAAYWQSRSAARRVLLVCGCIVVVAAAVALIRSLNASPQSIEKHLYGEEIGRNGLRYKHGSHIYDPETGEVLLDSITWLHVSSGDTIAILAKNHRRAFINLNTAQLITPLAFERAWEFACNRGVMARADSIFIFRRDGSLVTAMPIGASNQYEYLYYIDHLIVKTDYDHVGMLDTAGHWLLEPEYSMITIQYDQRLYNTRLGDECIVYNAELQPILRGAYKSIEIDWTEGLVVTEHDGIQRLYDYQGNLLYKMIFQRIEPLMYATGRKTADNEDIYDLTDCYVYRDYNDKCGLMDKHYKVLTPPLFHSIEAQTKHVFFATFGEYSDRFGTLIDDHGKALR